MNNNFLNLPETTIENGLNLYCAYSVCGMHTSKLPSTKLIQVSKIYFLFYKWNTE